MSHLCSSGRSRGEISRDFTCKRRLPIPGAQVTHLEVKGIALRSREAHLEKEAELSAGLIYPNDVFVI